MEVVDISEGRYELQENVPGSSGDSEDSSSYNSSEDLDKSSDEEDDLKVDLQKTIPECYKSDSNFASRATSDITNDEEFHANALCQFMDILNDLDEVLDKSLLACLDDDAKFDSDEDDLICKNNVRYADVSEGQSSVDDNTQVICAVMPSAPSLEDLESIQSDRPNLSSLGRSKSFTELTESQRQSLTATLERANTTNENLRNSMRRLDPIILPAISTQENLTLPVLLFFEHHVNMRPTSAPIQLQVTAANLSSDGTSGPLIVGRRALLMNRSLSLPSPVDSEVTGEWTGRNTCRSNSTATSTRRSSTLSLSNDSRRGEMTVRPDSSRFHRNSSNLDENKTRQLWPHRMSGMLACLSCTVGLFNISRFAMFSVHFGASFILQFLILSLLIGIPLFTLHLCLGQVLEMGPVAMWRISPIFQGVGVSLLITQAVIGMYSIVGLSWVLVYFRDSFITTQDKYKWAIPNEFSYKETAVTNTTQVKIQETIPQYFYGEVLQKNMGSNNTDYGTIKFQVAFNLAVVWMIVFVALSKGSRSYGKTVYMLIFVPICGSVVLCAKLLTLIPLDDVTDIFSQTDWGEFFVNSHSWAAAAQESFLTWGLLGACIMQFASHKTRKAKTTTVLQIECACIIACTFAVLFLGSFLANTCVQVLKNHGYVYVPGSFESVKSSQFIYPTNEPIPGNTVSTPTRYMGHYGSLVGITVLRNGNAARSVSGWQPLQLVTQIVPATLAVLPANLLSPAWAVLFYFILIMFGVAQQLAIWHCVICGILAINPKALKVWETTITFLSCVVGLAVGLMLSTDAGIRIIHFLDYVCVGSWWQCVVQIALTCGVFLVRGRPYSPDVVVEALYNSRSRISATLAAILSFIWTVALPVLLCAICVMDFRVGQQRQMYSWKKAVGYWPVWCRQVAVFLQQGALLIVPITAFIQTWRYMSKGPPDILDRIQNLYRPTIGASPAPPARPAPRPPAPPADPPPKYTPPPSYSTATSARLLNTLRRSMRRLRRIASHPETSQAEEASQIPITLSETVDRTQPESLPPQYSGEFNTPTITITDETNRPTSSSMSLTRDYLRRSFIKSESVKNIRSSLRRSFKFGGLTTSHEHLVRDAEPISNTVAMSAMLDTEDTHARSLASVI